MILRWFAMLPILLPAVPADGAAQTLTLAQALGRAEAGAYANRIAAAETAVRAGQADATRRAILPAVRLEGGYAGTNEPLGAFGSTLRQRAVTPAAFEPATLNYPEAIGNVAAALVLEQPIFNADGLFGRSAARSGAAAAAASESWARAGTALEVVRAYFAAVLATERVATLDSAARAAHAHERVAASQYRNGLATRSDVLLASVRAGQVDADLIAARGSARLARLQLALALGAPGDTAFALPLQLPDTASIARVAADTFAPDTGSRRADVQAARLAADAADADVRRASGLLWPRVNAFGRLDWNDPHTPFGGRESWTAGLLVSWAPFTGGSELAERRTATARRSAATAAAEAAEARGRLELQQAESALEVALARMEITGVAVAQSGEAHRIVTRKYEGGLATAVELFDAAAEETASRLGFAEARYQALVAVAERLLAGGRNPGLLTTLDAVDAQEH